MKGVVVQAFEKKRQSDGKPYWNVMIQEGEDIKAYLTSAQSLSVKGAEVEYTVDPPKKPGDTPWIRTGAAGGYAGARAKGGNVKAFACSYAKDIAVEIIKHSNRNSEEMADAEIVQVLEKYYDWFIKKMEE